MITIHDRSGTRHDFEELGEAQVIVDAMRVAQRWLGRNVYLFCNRCRSYVPLVNLDITKVKKSLPESNALGGE